MAKSRAEDRGVFFSLLWRFVFALFFLFFFFILITALVSFSNFDKFLKGRGTGAQMFFEFCVSVVIHRMVEIAQSSGRCIFDGIPCRWHARPAVKRGRVVCGDRPSNKIRYVP